MIYIECGNIQCVSLLYESFVSNSPLAMLPDSTQDVLRVEYCLGWVNARTVWIHTDRASLGFRAQEDSLEKRECRADSEDSGLWVAREMPQIVRFSESVGTREMLLIHVHDLHEHPPSSFSLRCNAISILRAGFKSAFYASNMAMISVLEIFDSSNSMPKPGPVGRSKAPPTGVNGLSSK